MKKPQRPLQRRGGWPGVHCTRSPDDALESQSLNPGRDDRGFEFRARVFERLSPLVRSLRTAGREAAIERLEAFLVALDRIPCRPVKRESAPEKNRTGSRCVQRAGLKQRGGGANA